MIGIDFNPPSIPTQLILKIGHSKLQWPVWYCGGYYALVYFASVFLVILERLRDSHVSILASFEWVHQLTKISYHGRKEKTLGR